ncbi:transcriptional regulator BetI [Tropicimonas marinistellae]|uniref:transcriptional regulator BetI n=1 Tax=Tropicimonas marinistellae TaxID=1739787 RepID=UPI00098EA6A7|nr:transcriptional regulator BetI [Tropicimonas marinistellae]
MPKLGMQPVRTTALIEAVITEIGESGTMDVTVSQIARRAGMSSALAHHYFGSKNKMFVAAMRHILMAFGAEVRENLAGRTDARERLEIIVRTSFSELNMHPETVGAWLNFYVYAQKSDEVARLLRIYHHRLRSNLLHELRQLAPERASVIAEGIASIIDGAYIRWVLRGDGEKPDRPEEIALEYLEMNLARQKLGQTKTMSVSDRGGPCPQWK